MERGDRGGGGGGIGGKGREEGCRYGTYNRIQMAHLKMLPRRIESLLYCLAHIYL